MGREDRRHSFDFLLGVCRPVLQNLTYNLRQSCCLVGKVAFLSLPPLNNVGFKRTFPLQYNCLGHIQHLKGGGGEGRPAKPETARLIYNGISDTINKTLLKFCSWSNLPNNLFGEACNLWTRSLGGDRAQEKSASGANRGRLGKLSLVHLAWPTVLPLHIWSSK